MTDDPRRRPRSRLRITDLARVGVVGLRARRLRTLLTALGIAIGIAAMVAVVGISASSKADLIAEIDALGTDLLRVQPGQSVFGETTTLPEHARNLAGRIGPVTSTAGITTVDATVRRNELVDEAVTSGIRVAAADLTTLDATSAELAGGRFLDPATERLPAVVLGADAASRLGIRTTNLSSRPRVWLGGEWFAVVGILQPAPVAPDLDSAALIGYPVAGELFGTTRSPSTLYVRTTPDQVAAVRAVLARSVDPATPDEVEVSRPSDALEARAATDEALRNLLLGLGVVALVVGGVGITNVMVISVLERRGEIGVRRAMGAKRMHIAGQFLTEATVLATFGGIAGVVLGTIVTAVYARWQGWLVDVPLAALAGGAGAALAVGLIAGVSPAIRARPARSRRRPATRLIAFIAAVGPMSAGTLPTVIPLRSGIAVAAAAAVLAAVGATAATASTAPTTTTTTTAVTLPVPLDAPADNVPEPQTLHGRIQIPAIEVDSPFIEGIRINTLDYGPGHWPGTAMPGQLGNVVVAGHRTSHNADFRRLDELKPGDQVIFDLDQSEGFERGDGVAVSVPTPDNYTGKHVYVVHSVEIVTPDAMWVVTQDYRHSATLFACHPPGSVAERIVAFLDLVDPTTLALVDPPRPTTTTSTVVAG